MQTKRVLLRFGKGKEVFLPLSKEEWFIFMYGRPTEALEAVDFGEI